MWTEGTGMLWRDSRQEWLAWVKGIYLTDGHHIPDSSVDHLVGSEGGCVLHPFLQLGLVRALAA